MKSIVVLLIVFTLLAGCADDPAPVSALAATPMHTPSVTRTTTARETTEVSTMPPTFEATFAQLVRTTADESPGVCRCTSDSYNCPDFSGHDSAQGCYNHCISLGRGDVHKLDRDGDGAACE